MASIFRDSFEAYNGISNVLGLFAMPKFPVATSDRFSFPTGRFAGKCLQVGNFTNANGGLYCQFDSAVSNLTMHAGWQFASYPSTDSTSYSFFHLLSDANFVLNFVPRANGSIEVYRATSQTAGTLLGATAANVYLEGLWYSWVLEVVHHASNGRITLYIDDMTTPKLNLTGINTGAGTYPTLNRMCLGSPRGNPINWGNVLWDDVYVTDSATKLTNLPRAELLLPNGDGSTLNWTPSTGTSHFAVIDENPPVSTDYLQASTVGNVDEIALSNLVGSPTQIYELRPFGFGQRTDATSRAISLGIKSGASVSDSSDIYLNSSGNGFERVLTTDPASGIAFTVSDVNALQLRPKVTI